MEKNFQHTYNHPWVKIAKINLMKYPHPKRPEILSIDIIEREINDEKLVITKLITCHLNLPPWLKRFTSDQVIYSIEKTEIDIKNKKLTVDTNNITCHDYVSFHEKCLYYSRNQPVLNETILDQNIQINCHIFGIKKIAEKIMMDYYIMTINLGREIVESLV